MFGDIKIYKNNFEIIFSFIVHYNAQNKLTELKHESKPSRQP